MTLSYAICRIQKIKDWGSLGASVGHTTRSRETLNADPDGEIIRLIGKPEDSDLEVIVKQKIGSQKIRKNAVLAVEFLLTASPEYFRPEEPGRAGHYEHQRLEDFQRNTCEWLQTRYGDRIVRAELHLDEATPHIHAYLVPLDEKGKLNCRALFGGREKLSKLQDSFASAVASLGLERGIKGSKATHTKVKEYYAAVNQPPDLTLDAATIHHQLVDRQRVIELQLRAEQKAITSEKQRQQLQQRVTELEAETLKWKQQADQLRDLPLEDVAWHLGLDLADKGRNRWKGQGRIIGIDGFKFYDFSPSTERGGGGSIDLVMHFKSCTFRQAVAWLCDSFGESGMLQAVTHHATEQAREIVRNEPVPDFVAPTPDARKWDAVVNYLVEKRKLPLALIQSLHKSGRIYADSHQNAVFVMRSLLRETTGAFLRGTAGQHNSFLGYAPNTKRQAGWFYFEAGGSQTDVAESAVLGSPPPKDARRAVVEQLSKTVERAVLTKSPIDAMSLFALECPPPRRTLYLVTDSANSLPVEFLKKLPEVVAAYDRDDAGNETAACIKRLLPQTTRLRPKYQDWNKQLAAQQKQQKRHVELEGMDSI